MLIPITEVKLIMVSTKLYKESLPLLSSFAYYPPERAFLKLSSNCLDGKVTSRSHYVVAADGNSDVWRRMGDTAVAIWVLRCFTGIDRGVRAKALKVRVSFSSCEQQMTLR